MSYYEILKVPKNADNSEIKRAYFSAVKKHSPDRDPEKFKAIRAAYQTLSDPKSRAAYDEDFNESLPDGAQAIILEIKSLMTQNQYKHAEIAAEAFVNIYPNLSSAKKIYAEVLLYMNKTGKAEKICKELHESDPSDAGIMYLRAQIANSRGFHKKAEEYFQKAADMGIEAPEFWANYVHYTIQRGGPHAAAGIISGILAKKPDIFAEEYLLYLFGIQIFHARKMDRDKIASVCMEQFAYRFNEDKYCNERDFRLIMGMLSGLVNADPYIYPPFFEKILPALEGSIHLNEDDIINLRVLKIIIAMGKLRRDIGIHEILVDLTAHLLECDINRSNNKNQSIERNGMEAYIVIHLKEMRTYIKNLRNNYPDYFDLNRKFYMDCLDPKKERELNNKHKAFVNMIEEDLVPDQFFPEDPDDWEEDDNDYLFDVLGDIFDEDFHDIQPYVREAPKVGRNDICPCGSGKKYKRCCGK